jgi:uncharacterized protein YggE
MKKILLGAALLIAPAARADVAPPRFIQVTGEGEVKAAPDQVVFNFGLESAGRDLAAAKKDNAERTKTLLSALRKNGIDDKNVQTNQVQIFPRYNFDGAKRRFVDYAVRKNFVVTFTDLNNYGKVLDAALEAGVEEVNGPNFGFAKPETLEAQARSRAAADARAKADALAADLGVKVGAPLEISEANVQMPVAMFGARAMKAQSMDAGGGDVLAAGQSSVRATVTVKFELK